MQQLKTQKITIPHPSLTIVGKETKEEGNVEKTMIFLEMIQIMQSTFFCPMSLLGK